MLLPIVFLLCVVQVRGCADGETELRVELNRAHVDDADPLWGAGHSDVYVVLTCGTTAKTSTYIDDDDHPTWDEFFYFGCQAIGSEIQAQLMDYDSLDSDDELFTVSTTDWVSGEQKLYNANDDDEYVVLTLVRSSLTTHLLSFDGCFKQPSIIACGA